MPIIQPQNDGQSNGSENARAKAGLISRAIQKFASYLPVRHIRKKMPDGSEAAYLERYSLIRTRPFSIYLHHFVDRDQDREMHDHPWSAASLVLTGWYIERRLMPELKTHERKVRFGNLIRPDCFHMITEAKVGTWTLLIRFKRTKGWGFIGDIQNGQASYRPAAHFDDQRQQPEADKHII